MERHAGSPAGSAAAAHHELSVVQMVLANRPWRLVRDLSKVLVATLASAGFFIVNANAWTIADQLPALRHALLTLLAIAGLAVWLVVAHGLWEKPGPAGDAAVVNRVNAATTLTLLIGLCIGFGVLMVVVLLAMALVVPESFAASSIKHPAELGDYLVAAWFASSMATVVGAIGSGLESDDEVHGTIRRYRPRLPGSSGR